jgi:hypothetical protein
MRRQANKNRSKRSFKVGDMVFLKLQPYVQASVARHAHHTLAFKFFGPYRILDRVGAVAYKLDLPSTAAVHPVFPCLTVEAVPGRQPGEHGAPESNLMLATFPKFLFF